MQSDVERASIQVDTLIRELQDSSARAQKLFAERTPQQLLHRPGEKSWSAGECVEHLNLSNRAYLARLEPILADLRSRNVLAVKPFRLNWNAALLNYWLEPRKVYSSGESEDAVPAASWSGIREPVLVDSRLRSL
jgi:hypothetical protein